MVNMKGLINFSSCVGIAASKEEAQGYANAVEENAKSYTDEIAKKKVDVGNPSSFSDGAMVYAQFPDGRLGFVHARGGYNKNEIVMRDEKMLTHARPSDYNQKIVDYYDNASAACGKWPKSALVPRDYVDKLVKGDTYGNNGYAPLNSSKKIENKYLPDYAPLVDGKIPAEYLPSYLDDIVYGRMYEGKYFEIKELGSEAPFDELDYDGYLKNPRKRVLYISEEHLDWSGNP
jgi:hypothetical protein